MILFNFSPSYPIKSSHLPLTLMKLDDWVLINVTGRDSEKYLQGQLTCDVTRISNHQHLLTAHCSPNGKVLSNLHLFRYGDGFSFIERRSVYKAQLFELKKYSVFSKVVFVHEENLVLLGVAGFQARKSLKNIFNILPDIKKPLVHDREISLMWFEYPEERFLLVTGKKKACYISEALQSDKAKFSDSQQWLALHIEAGIPVIDIINSGRFIPQAINLQIFGGISFNKGCYIGQEIVARAEFRGINKCALYFLEGFSNRIPEIGESLELKIGENWRPTGTILALAKLNDNRLLIQAVIRKNIEPDCIFRVQGDMNILSLKPLPYSLLEKKYLDC